MKRKLRLYSVILFPVTILLMVLFPSEKSIMNVLLFSIIAFISLWLISFFVEGNSKNNTNENDINLSNISSVNDGKIEIPNTCPHCKNPNTKQIRTCEWCGSQIC